MGRAGLPGRGAVAAVWFPFSADWAGLVWCLGNFKFRGIQETLCFLSFPTTSNLKLPLFSSPSSASFPLSHPPLPFCPLLPLSLLWSRPLIDHRRDLLTIHETVPPFTKFPGSPYQRLKHIGFDPFLFLVQHLSVVVASPLFHLSLAIYSAGHWFSYLFCRLYFTKHNGLAPFCRSLDPSCASKQSRIIWLRANAEVSCSRVLNFRHTTSVYCGTCSGLATNRQPGRSLGLLETVFTVTVSITSRDHRDIRFLVSCQPHGRRRPSTFCILSIQHPFR